MTNLDLLRDEITTLNQAFQNKEINEMEFCRRFEQVFEKYDMEMNDDDMRLISCDFDEKGDLIFKLKVEL